MRSRAVAYLYSSMRICCSFSFSCSASFLAITSILGMVQSVAILFYDWVITDRLIRALRDITNSYFSFWETTDEGMPWIIFLFKCMQLSIWTYIFLKNFSFSFFLITFAASFSILAWETEGVSYILCFETNLVTDWVCSALDKFRNDGTLAGFPLKILFLGGGFEEVMDSDSKSEYSSESMNLNCLLLIFC